MEPIRLHCFGVGEGIPCGNRNHGAFLYETGKGSLLVDCGEPLSRSYKKAKLSYEQLDAILLSHYHFDHVGGFFLFLQSMWLEQRKRKLPIHLPGHGIGSIQTMLETACVFPELLTFECQWNPLENGVLFSPGDTWRVTPCLTTHLDGLKKRYADQYPGRFESFCFLLECEGLRIGHSADLGGPNDLAPLLVDPLDVLVCELSHFYPETLFEFLRPFQIGRLVLVHIHAPWWENRAELRKAAERMLPGVEVVIPEDGQVLEIGKG